MDADAAGPEIAIAITPITLYFYREIRYFLPGDYVALHVRRRPDRIRLVVPHPPVPPLLAKGPLCNVLPPLEWRRRGR